MNNRGPYLHDVLDDWGNMNCKSEFSSELFELLNLYKRKLDISEHLFSESIKMVIPAMRECVANYDQMHEMKNKYDELRSKLIDSNAEDEEDCEDEDCDDCDDEDCCY